MYSTKTWGQLLKLAEIYKILLHCMRRDFHRQEMLKWRNLLCHSLLIRSDKQPDTCGISPWLTKSIVGAEHLKMERKQGKQSFVCAAGVANSSCSSWPAEDVLMWESHDGHCPSVGDFNPEPGRLTGGAGCGIQDFCENSLGDVMFLCSTEITSEMHLQAASKDAHLMLFKWHSNHLL